MATKRTGGSTRAAKAVGCSRLARTGLVLCGRRQLENLQWWSKLPPESASREHHSGILQFSYASRCAPERRWFLRSLSCLSWLELRAGSASFFLGCVSVAHGVFNSALEQAFSSVSQETGVDQVGRV
mmetsp:Transcript_29797/g.79218  ORF Transcript_29797/g.79218 Transcript_29797/m.79218 type:complete len:127 (+) Transcript_29797:1586-1966(+)